MKKIILSLNCFLTVVSIISKAQSPTFEWAKNIGGYYGFSIGISVALDASGNVYSTGHFSGRVDFDPGAGIVYLTSTGGDDIFITKSGPSGNLLWAKQLGGSSNDQGNSIAADGSGNVYITGSFSGTADFDPGAAVYSLTSAGSTDIFVFKSDVAGNLTWVKQFGSLYDDNGSSIALDVSGNVYTAGGFMWNVDFDPGAGTYYLNNLIGNAYNGFVSKLNSSGNFVWAKQFADQYNSITSMTLDGSGNIYTTGRFYDTVDFDPGPGASNMTAGTNGDIFICKLNSSGNFSWAKMFTGTISYSVRSIAADGAGNVYTTGQFYGTADFDPGAATFNLTPSGYYDVFISKLDVSGNFVWAKQIGAASYSESGNDIKVDASGNVYTTGSFGGNCDFDPGPGIYSITGFSGSDVFVSKLNSSGNFVWAKQIGGHGTDYATSLAMDASGNMFTTGYFNETCDFNPDSTAAYNLTALGGNFSFISKLNSSGNFGWAKSAGEGAAANAKAIAADAAGNVYSTGYFFGIVDFDPGAGTFNLSTAASDLSGDVFVSKSDASGNLIWARQLGGTSYDYPNAISVDASGNVYTAGSFEGTADFDPGAGVFNLTPSTSTGSDIFVSKLNASGNFVWAKKLGTTTSEAAYSIALDASGNIFTAGTYFSGTASSEIYLNKLDASGNLMWSKIYGGPSSEIANAIAADASGNIYITGFFNATVDFDPGAATFNMTSAAGNDIFVSKLDGSGNFIWAKQMEGTANEQGISIRVDASGSVYVAGAFNGTVDFDPGAATYNLTTLGNNDIFISKLNSTGNFLWAKQIGGSASDNARSMAIDAAGNVYTTGDFYAAVDFDPGAGTFNMTPESYDAFISKLDASGNFVWAQKLGGPSSDRGYSIALDGSTNIYTNGIFYETADFDPGPGTSYLTAHGYPDLFIHKMSQCITPLAVITPGGPTTFCSGGNVILNANTGMGLSYQWKLNSANIFGATNSMYTATAAGSYTVIVSNPCGSAISSATTVTVNSLPSATITPAGPTTFCSGGSVVLNAPVAANRTYQWKKAANLISGATQSSYTATTGGNYKVIVTNTVTGCSKTSANPATVTVNALPAATITPQGPTTFCAGGSVVLAANTGAGLTYKWKKGSNFISGATLSNYTATTGGNYRVQVTNGNGCSKTSALVAVSVPCKQVESGKGGEGESVFDFTVYPNPNSGEFTIRFSIQPIFPIQIELTDEIGKVVKRLETDDETVVINESNLAKGIYCLTARNKYKIVIKKINIVK